MTSITRLESRIVVQVKQAITKRPVARLALHGPNLVIAPLLQEVHREVKLGSVWEDSLR